MTLTDGEFVRIETAEPTDCEALYEIAEHSDIDVWTVENYRNELNRPDSIVLKAVDERRVVGYLAARVVPGQTDLNDAEIYNVAVVENRRESGIGSLLLDSLTDRLKSESIANVWLEVRRSNRSAISFYRKNGFSEISVRPNFYANPTEHAILMKLELNRDLLTKA